MFDRIRNADWQFWADVIGSALVMALLLAAAILAT